MSGEAACGARVRKKMPKDPSFIGPGTSDSLERK